MDKEQLRPITTGRAYPVPGFFHRWIVKVFQDEPGCEHTYALIEMPDGTVREVPATEVTFTDQPNS